MVDRKFMIKLYFYEICGYLLCEECILKYFIDVFIKYCIIEVSFDMFGGY